MCVTTREVRVSRQHLSCHLTSLFSYLYLQAGHPTSGSASRRCELALWSAKTGAGPVRARGGPSLAAGAGGGSHSWACVRRGGGIPAWPRARGLHGWAQWRQAANLTGVGTVGSAAVSGWCWNFGEESIFVNVKLIF
jgi:hypothetical protein